MPWDAHCYSKNSTPQYQAGLKFISSYKFKGNEKVLSIGCGPGAIEAVIVDLVPQGQVTGIDSSSSMIAEANAKHDKANLKFFLMDAQEISFPQKFDLIISTFCLHWVTNKALAFRKIAEHLAENGAVLLIMSLPNLGTAAIREKLIHQTEWREYFKDYDDPRKALFDTAYEKYAKSANLANIHYETIIITERFSNVEALGSFLKNIMALERLPTDALRDRFIKQLVNKYCEKHPVAEDGSCEITYNYVQLRAGAETFSEN